MDRRLPARSRALFAPKTEWIEEDETLTLRAHLSGFAEKHIDCRIIAPSRYIRVCSDPALQNWHFNTLFEDIPEKFDLYLAKTKFEDGIFTIKVPKKVFPAPISSGQENNSSKSEPAKQEARTTTNVDKEITEAKDGDLKGTNAKEGMSQKLEVDDQSTTAHVGDQEAGIEKDQEKRSESVDREKEGEGKDMEKSADQEKEEEAKDMENESSSASKSDQRENIVTKVVTERRYIVDKCTILSVILAIGAFVFYNMYGQSRKKKSVK